MNPLDRLFDLQIAPMRVPGRARVHGAPQSTELRLAFRLVSAELTTRAVDITGDHLNPWSGLAHAERSSLRLRFEVPHRDSGELLMIDFEVPVDRNAYWPDVLREALLKVVQHEVAESILIEGVRVFEPHP